MRKFLAIICGAAAIVAQAAQGAETKNLEPSSPWNVDYSEHSCALKRTFGEGDDSVLLEIRQFAPGDDFNVTVASKGSGFRERRPKVRFAPETKARLIELPLYLNYQRDFKAISWTDSLFPDDPYRGGDIPAPIRSGVQYKAVESAVEGLHIDESFAHPLFLQTGEMHKPLLAMRQCLEGLIAHWGLEVAAHRTLTRRAEPITEVTATQMKRVFRSKKRGAINGGRAQVRFIVSADGKPSGCHIEIVPPNADDEQDACAGLSESARFKPALNAIGEPIGSYYILLLTVLTSRF